MAAKLLMMGYMARKCVAGILLVGGLTGLGIEASAQELKKGYYPDGKIRYEGYFLNGQPSGKMTRYYPEGQVKAEMNYRGEWVDVLFHSKDGGMTLKGTYLDQQKEGVWEYRSGEQLLLTESYAGNLLNGTVTRYRQGEVAEIKNWKAGRLDGEWKLFYDNGNLKIEALFADGKLNGRMRSFASDGTLLTEGKYTNDLKEGNWYFYDPARKSERRVTYHAGKSGRSDVESLAETRRLDSLTTNAGKILDPALFTEDPESYLKMSGE